MAFGTNPLELDSNACFNPRADQSGKVLGNQEFRELQAQNGDGVAVAALRADDDAAQFRVPGGTELGQKKPAAMKAPADLRSHIIDRAALTHCAMWAKRIGGFFEGFDPD